MNYMRNENMRNEKLGADLAKKSHMIKEIKSGKFKF